MHSEGRSPPGPTHTREGDLHLVPGSSPPRETGVQTDEDKAADYQGKGGAESCPAEPPKREPGQNLEVSRDG